MNEPTDAELLLAASRGSRDALEAIARRYVGFVYNASLRQVSGDAHLAEDVTQAVFVILSRKIRDLQPGTLLHGWLFTTTHYAARNAVKMRKRRSHYEWIAASMRRERVEPAPVVEAITPMLDEALADLRDADRCAVLLSYFGGKTYREVGAQIGTTEEGARKRVERALGRMRRFFAQRGAAVTGAGVVAALRHSAQACVPPPAGLVESVASCMAASSVSGATLSGVAKGVIHMMTWTKLKVVAGVMCAVVTTTLVGAGAAMLRNASTAEEEKNPAPADAVVELANDAKVELLGISKRPSAGQAWWHADGTPAAAPYAGSNPDGMTGGDPANEREVVLRVTGPNIDDLGVRIELPDQRGWTSGRIDGLDDGRMISFNSLGKDTADLRVTVATGAWETILTQQPTGFRSDRHVVFSPAADEEGGCIVTTSDDMMDHQARVIAIGVDGQTHASNTHFLGITKGFRQMTTRFDLPKDEIDRFEFQARPFDQFVQFKNVSLVAGKGAEFKSENGKIEVKQPTDK